MAETNQCKTAADAPRSVSECSCLGGGGWSGSQLVASSVS